MYQEFKRPWFYWLLLGISICVILSFGYGGFLISVDAFGGREGLGTIIAFGLFLAFIGIYLLWVTWAVSVYFVNADGSTLCFGYRGWKVEFTNSEITSARQVDIHWPRWGGMGWRIKGLKKIGYITNSGSGVEIQTTRKGRTYTFNCNDPQALLDLLATAGVTTQTDSAI